jgi:integration host factor subunit alpha
MIMPNTPKTLTRADLSNSVHKKVGLSVPECNALVDAVFQEISASLAKGESVKISSFGTFELRGKKQRMGRNPKTGVEVPITPRNVLSFNASNLLKTQVNKNLVGKNVTLA